MTTQIALLRAINLGPRNKVAMADLRALLEGLGFRNVRSLLLSGNLVFDGDRKAADVERLLEKEAAKELALETAFIVRTAAQWDRIVARNPFPAQAKKDPAHFILMACKKAPGKTLKLKGARKEIVKALGREIYIVYPEGIGRSRLKIDGVVGTGRNWNTVLKIAELARG